MSTSALSNVSHFHDDSDDEDILEVEEMYDSDNDKVYYPNISGDSSDDEAEEVRPTRLRQKVWCSTPRKTTRPMPPATDLPGPSTQAGPSTAIPPVTPPHRRRRCSSADPLPMPSDESDASDVDDPAAVEESGDPDQPVVRRRRRERSAPPLVNFQTATVFSKSKYKWNCRPQSTS